LIEPSVLILASRFDLTCDFVISALRRLGAQYVRLNSEDLPDMLLSLDPKCREINVSIEGIEFQLSNRNIQSVLYRRPVFLRDYGGSSVSPIEQLKRHHWAAFMRNFMILEGVSWMNHPAATYLAEHKAYQLSVAHEVGLEIPDTIVTNSCHRVRCRALLQDYVAIKGLDTVMVRDDNSETFGFTTFTSTSELSQEQVQAAPVVFQQALKDKLDLRVTVVGSDIFAASITKGGQPIPGDWRCQKADACFESYELPDEVKEKCFRLVSKLELAFGAIDLAQVGRSFYFLEINPTGEWAWLVDAAGLAIDESVASWLVSPSRTRVDSI